MRISKWGNSLAIRLPKAVVDALGLKDGDELKAFTDDNGIMLTREEALKRLRALRWDLPPDFKFDREEAHERGWRLDDPE